MTDDDDDVDDGGWDGDYDTMRSGIDSVVVVGVGDDDDGDCEDVVVVGKAVNKSDVNVDD